MIHGYTFIKRNRTQGSGDGVGVYIKDNIVWERRFDLEKDGIESIWLEMYIAKSKSLLVATYYRPPGSSAYLPTEFNKMFNEMLLNEQRRIRKSLSWGTLMLII